MVRKMILALEAAKQSPIINQVSIIGGYKIVRTVPNEITDVDEYVIAIGGEVADVCKWTDRADCLKTALSIKQRGNYATGYVTVIRVTNDKRITIAI